MGQTAWTVVSTRTLVGGEATWVLKPSYSASYKIVYSDTSGTYEPATSTYVRVNVARNLHDNFRRTGRLYYGKVSPKYAGRTVYIQKSTCAKPATGPCTWSNYKAIRTNATSNWSIKLPVYARKTHFRALVKASNGYIASLSNYYVSTWR